MKRAIVILALLTLAVSALATTPPPASMPRMGGNCVWANNSVYWYLGRAATGTVPDAAGKIYCDAGGYSSTAGVSIYNPTNNTWTSSKYDGTGPVGFDYNSDGICDWAGGVPIQQGVWTQSNQGFAYDDDSDGVKEIFSVVGWGQSAIWRFDPNQGARGAWTKKADAPAAWAGFRRGAVAMNGSKIYLAAGSNAVANKFGWYDIASNTWSDGPSGPATIRCGAAIVNNKLYVIGGTDNAGLNIYECDLAPATPVWTSAGASVATLQTGVEAPGVVAYNGKIYIIGGHKADGNASDKIQKFDPVTKTVTTIATMPAGRFSIGATVNPADGVLYYGGGAASGDTITSTDIVTDWWKTDLDNATLTFTAIATDPAYFPYQDWDPGRVISGTVTDPAGNAVPGAFVCLKKSAYATADPMAFGTADSNGHYSFDASAGTTYFLGAWKTGWAPTPDQQFDMPAGDVTKNLQLTKVEGKLIPIAPGNVSASNETEGAAANAVDGNLDSMWQTSWWPAEPVYFYIDFGQPTDFSGISIYRYLEGTGSYDNYSIDLMTAGTPLTPSSWENNPSVTNVYTATHTLHGLPLASNLACDPIAMSKTGVRGVRLTFSGANWPPSNSIKEIVFHSKTEFASLAYGWVKDTQGHGIYNAAVQLGGFDGPTTITDAGGYWSMTPNPGSYELFADAPGFSPAVDNGTVGNNGTPYIKSFTLTAKNETKPYNGDFELAANGDATLADGWIVTMDLGGADGMYLPNTRTTSDNATPGGTACGVLTLGSVTDARPAGWLTTNPANRVPVNPNSKYNFYFKDKTAAGWGYFQWQLRWLRANGTIIYAIDSWDWMVPPTGWNQVTTGFFGNDWQWHTMNRMSPPPDAAYAEFIFGSKVGGGDPGTEYHIDDIVFDEVKRPAISGKVTDELGNPVAGAVVGVKSTTNAAADAASYGLTDVNGNYSVPTDLGNWYVAAWKAEYQVTADTQVSAMSDQPNVDLQFPGKAKKNLATKTSPVYATAGADSASKVVDGDVWANWDTGATPTATIAVDLGSTKTVSGVVIHWEYARAADYTVEVTTGDPANAGSTWTPVYTSTNGSGGWFTNYWRYMDPIRFPANTQARGVRINATKHFSNYDNYNIWEFQILGTADAGYSKKIGDVKALPVGTVVKIDKPVTVSGANGSEYGPAGTTFWVEEIDRSTGIKVVVPTDGTGAILAGMGWPGEVADLTGTIAKDAATGEIYIAATDVQTWQWAGKEFQPVGMNARALTTDMPTGLYVKTWGTVKSVDTTNYSFTIADGSTKDGAPVEITVVRGANMTAALPAEGQWISVKGVLTGGGKIYEWPVDGFIRGWLMNGAYSVDNPGGDDMAWQYANLTNDFFASAGTEFAIEPKLGDTAPNGGKWFAASIDAFSSAFDFNKVAFESVTGQPCVYASVWVKPATDLGETEGLQAWVGSADGYALIITNSIYASGEFGPFVYIKDNVKKDSVTPDADAISYDSSLQTMALKGGEWNHVMIKVNQVDAGFGIAARFMIYDPNDPSKMIPAPLEVSLQKP